MVEKTLEESELKGSTQGDSELNSGDKKWITKDACILGLGYDACFDPSQNELRKIKKVTKAWLQTPSYEEKKPN